MSECTEQIVVMVIVMLSGGVGILVIGSLLAGILFRWAAGIEEQGE